MRGLAFSGSGGQMSRDKPLAAKYYTDPDRFEIDKEKVFFKFPILAGILRAPHASLDCSIKTSFMSTLRI